MTKWVLDIGSGDLPDPEANISIDVVKQEQDGFVLGNAECLPLRDGAVDKIISTRCIGRGYVDPVAVKECHRVLNTGGELIMDLYSGHLDILFTLQEYFDIEVQQYNDYGDVEQVILSLVVI